MEQSVLKAARRDTTGKGPARQMRRDGLIPGVVYGMGKPPVKIAVSRHEFEHALGRHRASNVLFDLQVDGVEDEAGTAALVKDIQRHPISQLPESIDFQWVSLKEKVTVNVPVVLEGEAPAELAGAVIDQIAHEVPVSCLPLEMPQQLAISIEGIQLHETRTVSMLQLPEGVEVLADPDSPVVTCIPPRIVEEEQEAEVEGEIETLEEGEKGAEEAEQEQETDDEG